MKTAIIHKQGKQKVERYLGFGQYDLVGSPLCVGAKMLYKGNAYYISRKWDKVTCKHCLKRKNS
jgi:hypothetical protein